MLGDYPATFFEFTVPGKPVPKQSTRKSGSRFYRDPRITKHQNLIKREMRHAGIIKPLENIFSVEIIFNLKASESVIKKMPHILGSPICTQKSKGDCDNLAKCVLDGMNGLAFFDDSQVTTLIVKKVLSDHWSTKVFAQAHHTRDLKGFKGYKFIVGEE